MFVDNIIGLAHSSCLHIHTTFVVAWIFFVNNAIFKYRFVPKRWLTSFGAISKVHIFKHFCCCSFVFGYLFHFSVCMQQAALTGYRSN